MQIQKKLKYHNKITLIDNISFRSKKEADYYIKLKILKKLGAIKDFKRQVPYHLPPLDTNLCSKNIRNKYIKYLLDFMVEYKNGSFEYVDVKGYRTQLYKLKKLMVEYFYNIEIKEV